MEFFEIENFDGYPTGNYVLSEFVKSNKEFFNQAVAEEGYNYYCVAFTRSLNSCIRKKIEKPSIPVFSGINSDCALFAIKETDKFDNTVTLIAGYYVEAIADLLKNCSKYFNEINTSYPYNSAAITWSTIQNVDDEEIEKQVGVDAEGNTPQVGDNVYFYYSKYKKVCKGVILKINPNINSYNTTITVEYNGSKKVVVLSTALIEN